MMAGADNTTSATIETLESSRERTAVMRYLNDTRLKIGITGSDTAALGAATLPIFDEFNPQFQMLMKCSGRTIARLALYASLLVLCSSSL